VLDVFDPAAGWQPAWPARGENLTKKSLVGGICGSLIRSNGAGNLSPRTRCRMVRASDLFPASCLSSQFDFSDKRCAVRVERSRNASKCQRLAKILSETRKLNPAG